ncbi:unnamed protein product [Symbiodinium sp. CCMP2592]|nr:unnamed protein product [Symbiodinium sp. CCMP2592]
MAGLPVATSFTESKAAFAKRALEVGLAQAEVDHLVSKQVDTLSKLAFVLVPPGKVPEDSAVVGLLPAGSSQGAIAGLKRLLFEAHTLIVSALKQKVERTEESLPLTLDIAEREDRLASQKTRLGGLTFQGEEEVAHGAYDLVFSMAQKNELIWLAPEKFNTRRAEISAKKPSKELVIDGSGVAVKDKPQVLNCAINSDLDLVLAMRRRALAFDLVGLMSFDVANRYHQALVQRLQEAPPPNYAKVSIAQVLRADRAAFLRLAELLPTLRRSGVGKLPLDEQLPNILLDPSATLQRLEGQPLSEVVTVEVFCGTGRLSASLRSEGFDAFGVDHVVGKTACCSVLQLDLTCEASIAHLWSILKDPAVKFIHFAPPCGTASRARDIQFPGAPPVLRNESHPEGVPDLSEIPALRVQKANMLYKLTLELSSFCLLNGKYFSCENPSRSYLWLLPQWQQFLKRSDVFQTVFHHCEFGGMRRKETLLVHNIPKFRELHRLCSGKHVHLGWGKVGRTWATSAETAYPWGLCKCMASLLKDHFLELGCRQSPKAIDEGAPAIQGARAFTGAQTRKRVPPLLSEFASVHTVTVPSNLAASFLRPGQKLPSPWKPGDDAACSPAIECFPAGSRVLRAHVVRKGIEVREAMMSGSAERVHRKDLSLLLDLLPSEPLRWEGDAGAKSFQGGSFVHGPMCGVRSTTKQFPETVKAMCSYVKGLFPGLEFGTVGMFRDVSAQPHRDSNNEVSTDNAIAALSDFSDGSVWMEDPAGDVELEIKGSMAVAFIAQGLGQVGHPTQLSALMPSEISCAVRRIHKEGEANVAKERTATLRRWVSRAADLEPAERALKADLPQFRKDVLSPKRLALFEELLLEVGHEDVDLVKDIAHGFDLTGKLPRSNVFAKRFRPAEQSESQLRSSAKRLRDGLLATIKASEDPVIDQGVLKATLKELERGFVDGPLSPDQIPEDASLTHRFGVIQGSNEDGPKVRPIDNYLSSQVNAAVTQVEQVSVHTIDVVAGMLACWLNEWFVSGRPEHSTPVCKAWDLRTAYKQLPLSDLAYALDSFFVLFNIERGASEIYRQRDKELSYDALCVVLGVQVNLRDAKLGLAYLENTVKRRTEALCDIERALAALKLLSQHSRQRRWDVSQLTRLALTQLKSFLESSKPRPVRARREDFVHVYVDDSFEPNGHCGLGGVVFSSSGEALCWFGQAVAPVPVQKLLKAGDRERETVIFELEALVLSICLEAFRPYVERKGVVIFTDNEGVFGSFVRGHSDNASCAALIDFFACCEESLETICWLDRVPSSSNPADDPSRGVNIRGAPRVDLDMNLLSYEKPFCEECVWNFISYLKKEKAAPTRAASFISALHFANFVLGLSVSEVLASRRILGLSAQLGVKKKATNRARPLKVSEVRFMHGVLRDESAPIWDRAICAYLLLALYARARHSDLVLVEEVIADFDRMCSGYLEIRLRFHKTAQTISKKNDLLPVIVSSKGIVAGDWLGLATDAFERVGLTLDGAVGAGLFRPFRPGGTTPGRRSLRSSECTSMLKMVLERAGSDVSMVTSHSLKRTLLDWGSKFCLDDGILALLGRHSKCVKGSVPVYAKEEALKAVRALEPMCQAVAEGSFHPDAARALYFTAPPAPTSAPRAPELSASVKAKVEIVNDSASEQAEPEGEHSSSSSESSDSESQDDSDSSPESMAPLKAPRMEVEQWAAADCVANSRRADEVGLSSVGWTILQALGITSVGKAAYTITSPGEPVTEPIFRDWVADNAAGMTLGDQSCVKRLVFESQTLVVAELRDQVSGSQSSAPRRVPEAERDRRLSDLRAALPGITLEGVNMPSNALLDSCCQQERDNLLKYIPPEKATSRTHELTNPKPTHQALQVEASKIVLKSDADAVEYQPVNALQTMEAFRRRGLAMVFAQMISYDAYDRKDASGEYPLDKEMHRGLESYEVSIALMHQAPQGKNPFRNNRKRHPSRPSTPDPPTKQPKGKGRGKGAKGSPAMPKELVDLKANAATPEGLWIEGAGDEVCPDPGHPDAKGHVLQLHEPIQFDAHQLHATCPWTGNRAVLAAFVINDFHKLDAQHRQLLQQTAFRLPSLSTGELLPSRPSIASRFPVILEIFAGTARVTAALRCCGFVGSQGVDHVVVDHAACPVLLADLTTREGQSMVMMWLSSPHVVGVFIAPPCGTSSRAREIALPGPSPAPLRSLDFPDGLPHLSGLSMVRVNKANQLYHFTSTICAEAHRRSLIIAVENPRSSLYWSTSFWKAASAFCPMHTDFQHCAFGGRRPKWTRLCHNHHAFHALHRVCPGGACAAHHLPWGRGEDGAFATVAESAHPPQLATAIAQCFAQAVTFVPEAEPSLAAMRVHLTGQTPCSGVFPGAFKPAKQTSEQLRSKASESRQKILDAIKSQGHLDEALEQKVDEEVELGWLSEPTDPADLPEGATISRRFAIEQSGKIRLIDDLSDSGVNGSVQTTESPKPPSLDVVAAMALACLRKLPGIPMLGKTFDLKSAYRQMFVSPDDLKEAYIAYFSHREGRVIVRQMLALPFGATRAVFSYLRVAHSMWYIGCWALKLIWSHFFDDFLSLATQVEAKAVDLAISSLFRLLGWKVSEDKDKPFAESFAALGVRVSFERFLQGEVLFHNTEKRVLEVSATLRRAADDPALTQKDLSRIRGRMVFAGGQLFGRAGRLCVAALAGESCSTKANLSNDAKQAMLQFADLLEANWPRVLKDVSVDPVYVFTDASYSETSGGTFCGFGGVCFDHEGRPLGFFSEELSSFQKRLLGEGRSKTIIFEAELATIVVAYVLWKDWLRGKPAVIFVDNNSARDVSISGTSRNDVGKSLASLLLTVESLAKTFSWFARVPSPSNIADTPSREVLKSFTVSGCPVPHFPCENIVSEVLGILVK